MKNLPISSVSLLSLALMITSPALANRKIDCGDAILKTVGIWEKSGDRSLEVAAEKAINQNDHSFKLPVKNGVISVWDAAFQKGKVKRVIVSKTKDNPASRDLDVRMDPDRDCAISSISFYEPEITIAGEDCYWISVESRKTDDDGSEFSNPTQHNEHMINYIKGIVQKHKAIPPHSERILQRIRDNCRNRATLSKLSKGPGGMSHSSETNAEIKFHQQESKLPEGW
jgi:hypothetical protein